MDENMLIEDAPDDAIVAGVPADVKKYRFEKETIAKLLEMEWWNGSEDELKKVGEMEFRVGEYLIIKEVKFD